VIFSALYLLVMVAVNIGFAYVPLVHGWPPMSLAVGFVFVLRDFAQREMGHKIIALMLLGAVLSYLMASPAIALASCAAYLVGESVDWALYTWLRRPMHDRVLVSSLLGTPLGLGGVPRAHRVLLVDWRRADDGQQAARRDRRLRMDAGACVRFFTGLHQPSDAPHFDAAFISVTRLTGRKGRRAPDAVRRLDHGLRRVHHDQATRRLPEGVEPYADAIRRWATNGSGRLLAAVSQDFMCEPEMLKRTGLSIPEHQRLTIERYDALMACKPPVYILPVLQGYAPADYVRHLSSTATGWRMVRGWASARSASATRTQALSSRCCWRSRARGPTCCCMGSDSRPRRSGIRSCARCCPRPTRWRGASTRG
jgi:hypothetical protein